MESEREELQEAIKEISVCIQTLQDVPIHNDISKEIIKRYIIKLSKEKTDYEEYMESVFPDKIINTKEDGK